MGVSQHGGNVVLRERVGRVRNEQARLADGTIADDNTFNGLVAHGSL